jgi:hypothetical protein
MAGSNLSVSTASLTVFSPPLSNEANMTQIHWLNPISGSFTNTSDWSGGVVPGAGDDAILDAPGTTPYAVTASTNGTISSLQTAADATFDISTQSFTVINGTGIGANAGVISVAFGATLNVGGTVHNSGQIILNNPGVIQSAFTLIEITSSLSLNGGGTITLKGLSSDLGGASAIDATTTATLTNVDNTISGGLIGSGNEGATPYLTLVNQAPGVIKNALIATGDNTISNAGAIEGGTTLSSIYNTGLLVASDGTLDIGPQNGAIDSGATIKNIGTIQATGTGTVELSQLFADEKQNTYINSGIIEATAAGGSIEMNGAAVNSSTGGIILAANGGYVSLDFATLVGGTLETSSGGVIETGILFARATLDGTTSPVNNQGVLTVQGTSTLMLEGTINNTGSIVLNNAGHDSVLQPYFATLTGGGSVSLGDSPLFSGIVSGNLTNADNTIMGSGNLGDGDSDLINQAAGVIDASGSRWMVLDIGTSTIANAGLIEATGTGGLSLRSAVSNAGGGVIAAAGGSVFLQGADILGGTLRSTGGRIIYAQSGVNTLDGTASTVDIQSRVIIDNGQNLNLAGAIDNTGLVQLISDGTLTTLTIAAAGATLTGGGQVFLGNDNAAAEIIGAVASATLTNVGEVIAGAGDVGGGRLTLVNEVAGVIAGENAVALIVDTGTNTIVNAGRIENAGKGGTIVQSAVNNTGALIAEGGTLTVNGAVSGTGEALIYSGTLDFASSFSQKVAFKATSGVLELAQSQAFAGTILGFSKTGGTSLDLRDIAFGAGTQASYSGTAASGVLTVTDGSHTARLTLIGDYRASTFTASSDGHGRTSIVDPTKAAGESAAPPHAFIAAMAGLAGSAGGVIQTGHPMQIHGPMLARPRAMIA